MGAGSAIMQKKFKVGDRVKVNYHYWAGERCGVIVAVNKAGNIDFEVINGVNAHIYVNFDPEYLRLELVGPSPSPMDHAVEEYEEIIAAQELLNGVS